MLRFREAISSRSNLNMGQIMAGRLFSQLVLDRSRGSRRRVVLNVETLESRATPAALTAYETHALQVVNQLRTDPTAFANDLKLLYLGGTYQSPNGYAASDPIWTDLRATINNAQAQSSWRSGFTSTGPNTFMSMASGLAAKPPLVWDSAMQDGAVSHNDWMYDNVYAHSVFQEGQNPQPGETPMYHVPGIPRNFNASPGDYFNYVGLGLNAAGENISWGYNQFGASLQAYKNGQMSLDGFYQRMAYADTLSFMLEHSSGGSWGHLQNLASADYNFNVVGLANYLYENPAETLQDGVAQSYFSTHRLGMRSAASYASFLTYQDLNSNNAYDAGEGVPGQITYNFGAGSPLTLPATGYGGLQIPQTGTYTISASYQGNSLGSQQLVANATNKTFAFKVGSVQATTTTLTSTPNASTGGSLVTFTATVGPSPGSAGTVDFLDNGVPLPGGSNVAVVGGVATIQISTLSAGTHPISATYSGASGFGASTSNTVNQVVTAAAAPQLVSVTVNGNIQSLAGAQRSRVVSLEVVFDQAVQLDQGAFALALHTNSVVWLGDAQAAGFGSLPTSLNFTSSDNKTWVVTFVGNTETGGDGLNSIKDGLYAFNIDASKVHPLGAAGVNMVANPATTVFHRLFGDSNAPSTPVGGIPGTDFQAIVNSGDNLAFRGSFNVPGNYKNYFDYTGDAAINSGDNLQFRNRFNKALSWKV
jgi:hypothetical protein